jgi:LEA14-like dessication related protein
MRAPTSLLLLALVTAACASGGGSSRREPAPPPPPFDRPMVALRDVHVNGVGITGGSMRVTLRVYNPNDYRLVEPRVWYRVYVDGDRVAAGLYDVDAEIPARDSATIEVPVPFKYGSVSQAGRAMVNSGAVSYRVLGTIVVGTPYGRLSSPYDRAGQFAALGGIGSR